MANIGLGVLVNPIWDSLHSFDLVIVTVLALVVWQCLKYRKSQRVLMAADLLIDEANRVVNHWLNGLPEKEAEHRREFEIWEDEIRTRLERFRRQRICNGWHVDHLSTLVRMPTVRAGNLDAVLNGRM